MAPLIFYDNAVGNCGPISIIHLPFLNSAAKTKIAEIENDVVKVSGAVSDARLLLSAGLHMWILLSTSEARLA